MKYKLTGRAIVFDEVAKFDDWQEIIKKGAVSEGTTDMSDVCLFFRHNDRDVPMARCVENSENNTMIINIKEQGVEFEAIVDDRNSTTASVVSAIKRGDIKGCSFAGIVKNNDVIYVDDVLTSIVNDISKVIEISITTNPAYSGTFVKVEEVAESKAVENAVEEADKEKTEDNNEKDIDDPNNGGEEVEADK